MLRQSEIMSPRPESHPPDPSVLAVVRRYLRNLAGQGIATRMGVLFGSYASGHPDQWSDIDLLVVSPVFDGAFSREAVNCLWRVGARTDSRIEPIPCGQRQWTEDSATPLLEIVRREGVQVLPDDDPGS
ncbi:MAG TPA: nucleotidyltransferase domain-containing protein [Phycisphaerales bacterium]|nr:nucleotidyltransferase domain-containing protein [Phycisphaerales bacterium]